METVIPLVVRNISLNDDETANQLALHLSDLGWGANAGQVVASVYTADADPVAAAAAAAVAIKRALPQARVERVDEQFVSLADIAARTGLSHEAIRLWATGKRRASGQPFPDARAHVGQGRATSKIWTWPQVRDWLKAQYCLDLDPDVAYLSPQQVMSLNALLAQPPQERWQPVAQAGVTRTLAQVDAALEEGSAARSISKRFAVQGSPS
ncbi:hypothetical protein [Streptomyces anulatus]|uniref:hypothetical protein n=1 Tax=Streptomyces anulatus TaxID=1892 RepID=UPI0036574362